jgi:Ran GTPase-activating protein (RanGAP) involved in mRNA processing and transport
MSYGDKYIDVLGKSIKKIPIIKDFELKGNRITKESSAAILSSINQQALSIDLSNNRIGLIGCSHLSKFLSIRETCKLEYLNLEENYLGNTAVIDLLKGVEFNRTLKYMNLSKNYLSDEISETLKNFLERGILKELYLHWNLLKYSFG